MRIISLLDYSGRLLFLCRRFSKHLRQNEISICNKYGKNLLQKSVSNLVEICDRLNASSTKIQLPITVFITNLHLSILLIDLL